jgi:hypothetical protein
MKASLRALLANVIDYAGLFPPAELSLDESIRNYARYRNEPEAWMLGRFICPAARLNELASYAAELFTIASPLHVSALGRGGKTADEFLAGFERDVEAIIDFKRTCGARVTVDVLEVKLPPSPEVAFDFTSEQLKLFLEAPPGTPDFRRGVAAAMDVAMSTGHGSGFKLRTGGVESSAFPTTEQVAYTIIHARAKSLPIKFTAGLHHPIRHFNKSVNAKMHGFVNVFAAGAIAQTSTSGPSQQSVNELVGVLEDENPASFRFDDDALWWQGQHVKTQHVRAVREHHVISFGSCSFDEPRDDLRALGWL